MSDTETVAAIESLRARNPEAVRLAALVSTAMRVEPRLLRLCRIVLPQADVGTEADLWASDLLASFSPNALTLRPHVARALRHELSAMPDAVRDEACQIVAGFHRDEHWSVRLEELVNQLEVTPGADNPERQRDLLLAAVGELRASAEDPTIDPQVRVDIARWLLAALARLPTRVENSDAGFAASVAGTINLDGRVAASAEETSADRERWRSWLIESANTGSPLEIGVRFLPGTLELNARSGADVAMIVLPWTEPCVADVHSPGPRGTVVTRVHIEGDEPLAVPVTADEVVISGVDGARWTVRRGGVPPPGGFDFGAVRAGLRPCLARDRAVDQVINGIPETWWTVIAGKPGIGKSTLLNRVLDEFALPHHKALIASHFFGVNDAWDEPMAMASSIEAQIRAAAAAADLPALPDVNRDHPGRQIEEVLASAAQASSGVVIVALDALPGSHSEGVKSALFERVPVPSKPPPGVHFLATHGVSGRSP